MPERGRRLALSGETVEDSGLNLNRKGRPWAGWGAGKAAGLERGEARLQERALRERIGDKGWKGRVGPKPKS